MSAPHSEEPSDLSLIQAAAGGAASALGTLYDRHAPTMLAVARRIVGDEREAQDLLHDVFLEVWAHAADHDPDRGSVRTWILMRLRSRALDRRGRMGRGREAVRSVAATRPGGNDDPLREERLAVRQGLERLSDDVRGVLERAYFLGMTAKEIAAETDVPEGTVKSRRARGLSVLEGLLSDHEELR